MSVITVKEVSEKECRAPHSRLYYLSSCQSICLCASKPWQTPFTKRNTCFQRGKAPPEIWHPDQRCAVIHQFQIPLRYNIEFIFKKKKYKKKNSIFSKPVLPPVVRLTAQSRSHCICLSRWLEFHFKCQVNSYFPEQSRDWINNKKERRRSWNRSSKRLHVTLAFTNCYFNADVPEVLKSNYQSY